MPSATRDLPEPVGVDSTTWRPRASRMMPTVPPLTVLMPVRNAEATLGAALGSLAAQSIDRFEVLIVDDGSTDASRDLVHQWRDRLPGLTVLERSHRGVAVSL